VSARGWGCVWGGCAVGWLLIVVAAAVLFHILC
jgi:hypothetical protein